jgi:hypothetical protein
MVDVLGCQRLSDVLSRMQLLWYRCPGPSAAQRTGELAPKLRKLDMEMQLNGMIVRRRAAGACCLIVLQMLS